MGKRGRKRKEERRKGGEKGSEDDRGPAKGGRRVDERRKGGKTDRASIIRLDISGIFTKGTRRNACSIS